MADQHIGDMPNRDEWGIHRKLTRLERYLLLVMFTWLVDSFGAQYGGRAAYTGDIVFICLSVFSINVYAYRRVQ